MSTISRTLAFVTLLSFPLACDKSSESVSPDASDTDTQADATPAADDGAAATGDVGSRVSEILAMDHRSDDNRARDQYRHPAQTLAFFGVQPDSTVVELWAGGGWYTEVLAPLVRDQGKLIVTQYSKEGPEDSYRPKAAKKYEEKLAARPDVYDKVEVVVISDDLVLAPEGTVDVVLTFRNSHGWFRDDQQEKIYGAAFAALKPGGVFGVVQHRADEGADPKETAPKGYLPEAAVIAAAEAVGFELAEKSEINANAKDTKDHPEGVWTLPPGFALKDKDHDKYAAIGESDRMTLKFIKPE
jgi:predicted methyltransferase